MWRLWGGYFPGTIRSLGGFLGQAKLGFWPDCRDLPGFHTVLLSRFYTFSLSANMWDFWGIWPPSRRFLRNPIAGYIPDDHGFLPHLTAPRKPKGGFDWAFIGQFFCIFKGSEGRYTCNTKSKNGDISQKSQNFNNFGNFDEILFDRKFTFCYYQIRNR